MEIGTIGEDPRRCFGQVFGTIDKGAEIVPGAIFTENYDLTISDRCGIVCRWIGGNSGQAAGAIAAQRNGSIEVCVAITISTTLDPNTYRLSPNQVN